jgi:hypothetical protein
VQQVGLKYYICDIYSCTVNVVLDKFFCVFNDAGTVRNYVESNDGMLDEQ